MSKLTLCVLTACPLTCGFFSVVNTAVLHDLLLFESVDVDPTYRGANYVRGYTQILTEQKVGTFNFYCAIQASNAHCNETIE